MIDYAQLTKLLIRTVQMQSIKPQAERIVYDPIIGKSWQNELVDNTKEPPFNLRKDSKIQAIYIKGKEELLPAPLVLLATTIGWSNQDVVIYYFYDYIENKVMVRTGKIHEYLPAGYMVVALQAYQPEYKDSNDANYKYGKVEPLIVSDYSQAGYNTNQNISVVETDFKAKSIDWDNLY